MSRFGRSILVVTVCLCLLISFAACTANEPAPLPSPSPEVSAEPTPTPEPTAAEEFTPVGANVKLFINGNETNAVPYYGPGHVLILPLHPLAEALDFRVEKAMSGTRETLTISKDDVDEVVLQYIPPSVGQNTATNVTATKGGANITIDGTLFFIDGTVYVPEAFIDEALVQVDITVNETSVNVSPQA